jgi:hypothetical protein
VGPQRLGSLVGAVFGLVYVIVNAGALPSVVGLPLRGLGGIAFVAVLVAVRQGGDGDGAGRDGAFGRGYWLVVGAEVAALAAGLAVLNGSLDEPQAGVAWVSFVVGIHFFALAAVFGEPFFHLLGGAITACGVAGLALTAAGAGEAPIAAVSGVLPGALLLASGWWGARRAGQPATAPARADR